jgi:hypothetical protein
MIVIPTPADGYPITRMSIALSGATYMLWWFWNERDSAWYFDMDDVDGNPVVRSARVVLYADLLRGADPTYRPPYAIAVIDPTGGVEEPTQETLGKRFKVLYLEPST